MASGGAAASMLWLMCGGERKCGCKRAAASGVAVASVPLLLCCGKRQAAALLQACGDNIRVAQETGQYDIIHDIIHFFMISYMICYMILA